MNDTLADGFAGPTVLSILGFGIVGVLLRYVITCIFQYIAQVPTYWATMLINITGSVFIAICYITSLSNPTSIVIQASMVGLLGGFTTFSSYCLDAIKLIDNRQFGLAVMYILVTPTASLLLVALIIALYNTYS